MFTRLGSIADTNLIFDVTITTNSEHLTEHYKFPLFLFIGILCNAAITWFCITGGSPTCWHSPPCSDRRRQHIDWSYLHSATQ